MGYSRPSFLWLETATADAGFEYRLTFCYGTSTAQRLWERSGAEDRVFVMACAAGKLWRFTWL